MNARQAQAGVTLALTAASALPAHAVEFTPAPLAPVERLLIRDVADGAGPSHVIPLAGYLLVVDPWAAQIRRYSLADMTAAPVSCTYPRSFSPWRTERYRGGVRLIGEPYGPGSHHGYRYRSRETMVLAVSAVAKMPGVGPCAFPIAAYDPRRDTPPPVARPQGERPGAPAGFRLRGGARARIMPVGGPRSEIFAVRNAGALSRGRSLLWWSEIDDVPAEDEAAGTALAGGGRVTASQYVGVFDRRGGPPRSTVRVSIAEAPPLSPGHGIAVPALLVKPGFEYVAGASIGGRDALWVLSADMEAPSPRPFVLRRYDLGALADEAQGEIALAGHGTAAPDHNDATPPTSREHVDPGRTRLPRDAWYAAARATLRAQIAYRWTYPAGAAARPCGGGDRCAIGANAAGALGVGATFDEPVGDRLVRDGGAIWMRPRQLIGLPPGASVRGIPYSIGGEDLAEEFGHRLSSSYGGGAIDPPPIGHIREGLEWPAHDGNYPLGIDCSALVAKVYAIETRSTGQMVQGRDVVVGGHTYRLPRGPAHACPEPVRHLSQVRPGDLFLRDGHVVIYAGTARIGGKSRRSRGLRVFEASSRCGAVCESVYDPTFFAGWWIVRLQLGPDDEDCPRWLATATHAGGVRKTGSSPP